MSASPRPNTPPERVTGWIAEAQAGSLNSLGSLLEECRSYLLAVAHAELAPQLRTKAGSSDLVQETFLEAQRLFPRFQGHSKPDLLAWLRAILLNKLGTFQRKFLVTAKSRVAREILLEDSGLTLEEVAAETSTPSSLLMRRQQAEAVNQALARLPAHYRQIIVWRQWDELPFDEIARRLDRTIDAARMIWWRAVERLQNELGSSS
jgi:RNA polymerase sigma-70 factor, ECF subfamily